MQIIARPSPNFDPRPDGMRPSILMMHYTGMRTAEAAIARLTDQRAKVSSHYTIDEDGRVFAHVDEMMRAWHAGVSHWRGSDGTNSHAIGIEIVNPGHEFGYRRFPEPQIEAVIELSQTIVARHGISHRNVVGHSDVAPMRKEDPGELFPWERLAQAGVGLWPKVRAIPAIKALQLGDQGREVAALKAKLQAYGYRVSAGDDFDEATEKTVIAFQRHFRAQRFDGVADGESQAILDALLDLAAG